MNDSKTIGVRIPNWMFEEMIGSDNSSISERIKELITKGFLYEKNQETSSLKINRKNKNAVSVTWSRDYVTRGLAGFPESAIN